MKRQRKAERQNPPPSKYARWNVSEAADERRTQWLASKTILGELDEIETAEEAEEEIREEAEEAEEATEAV